MKRSNIIEGPFTTEARLKRAIRKELRQLGFVQKGGKLVQPQMLSKSEVRHFHSVQRTRLIKKNAAFIQSKSGDLIEFFADGSDIDPNSVRLSLKRVYAGSIEAEIFRLASLTWSVPVSNGFGRRLRYLVWDESAGKLAGIIALGDPVYNSSIRESFVGWSPSEKKKNLVNILDAYVLGAVPPYNLLLTGKVIACMICSKEVVEDFARTYGDSKGIISNEHKNARLLGVTTSSSMGRSSVYNRLKINGQQFFEPIGYTEGWGHFHFSDPLFSQLREYLRRHEHEYADNNRFGNGPNWKFRAIRVGLEKLGFDPGILRHGIRRQFFFCKIASNAIEILSSPNCKSLEADFSKLKDASEIAELGVHRWVYNRATRDNTYQQYRKSALLELLKGDLEISLPQIKSQG